MSSNSLPEGTAVQFNLINRELTKALDEYTRVQLSLIPLTRKPSFINSDKITARSFINKYERNISDTEKQPSDQKTFYRVKTLYNNLVSIAKTLYRDPRSYEEFELRCKLMQGILPKESENIADNLGGSNDDCYVFNLLFEIIFNDIEFTWLEKDAVKYCSGYSRKYKTLTHAELAKKLNISKYEIQRAERTAEKKIDALISKFKIFKPCIAYRLYRTYDSLNDMIIIRPDLCNSVREKERIDMTDLFIAKVISGICNYSMAVIDPGDRKYIRLIKNGLKDSKISLRFYRNLRKLFEPGYSTEATEDISDSIVERLKQGYKDYNDEFEEDYYEEEEILEQEALVEEEVPGKGASIEGESLDLDDPESLED